MVGVKRIKRYFVVFALLGLSLLLLNGCAGNKIIRHKREFLGVEKHFLKNYTVGQQKISYVGESFIRVRGIERKHYRGKHVRALTNFSISGGGNTMTGDAETLYSVKGETTVDGQSYNIIDIFSNYGINYASILVGSDGRVHHTIFNPGVIPGLTGKAVVSPPSLKFTYSEGDEYGKEKNSLLNYELIYGGTDGNSFKIAYREYTDKNIAREAFFQNLVYPIASKQIRFKDYIIKIHEATSEKLVFTISSDGLPNWQPKNKTNKGLIGG